MSDPQCLYRFYSDDGALLYIGISVDPGARFKQHRDGKPWWESVAKITMERHESRDAVRQAEREAIIAEKPLHNVQHNGSVRLVTPRRSHMVGRLYAFRDGSGNERKGELQMMYEIEGDPISEDFNARWDSPFDVFDEWRRRYVAARERQPLRYMARCVPITWYIVGCGTFESASPDNYTIYDEYAKQEWWGNFYTRPFDVAAKDFISDIKEIPYARKEWTERKQDKGGFITEATGFHPIPLQRWVDLDQLTDLAAARRRRSA